MAGQEKRRKLLELLERLAHDALGEDATPLDYVCDLLASGKTVTRLVQELQAPFGQAYPGETFTRQWFSGVVNHLTPDAKQRIATARADSAEALAEEAVEIIDNANVTSREAFQKDKERAGVRQWLAGCRNPQVFGTQKQTTNVQVNVGALHLDAFRAVRTTASIATSPQEARSLPEATPDTSPAQIGAGEPQEAA